MAAKSIVLFDGVCNLCNGFVNFLIERDTHDRFQFGSLQSEVVRELLRPFHYSTDEISTVLLIEDGQLHAQSTAVLKIFRQMPGAWPLMYSFMVLPRPFRDFLYNLVARNRYKIFGRKDACRIPTPELQSKFVG
jgi:predicted DCC family thiol-disulfide oxidoreductase YuxK